MNEELRELGMAEPMVRLRKLTETMPEWVGRRLVVRAAEVMEQQAGTIDRQAADMSGMDAVIERHLRTIADPREDVAQLQTELAVYRIEAP